MEKGTLTVTVALIGAVTLVASSLILADGLKSRSEPATEVSAVKQGAPQPKEAVPATAIPEPVNPSSQFSSAEIALQRKADALELVCLRSINDPSVTAAEPACQQMEALMRTMKEQNICWAPDMNVKANAEWVRCR